MTRNPRRRRRRFLPVPRPRSGSALPPELRPWRAFRIGEALAGGLEDPQLPRLLQRIDRSPLWPAYGVEIYTRGEVALEAMCDAIAGARREVLLESYIFKDDGIGRRAGLLLESAAARGVRVCVLADAIGSWATRGSFWSGLTEHGVEVRLFHTLVSHPLYQAYRDHRKILVVDRETAFTGGMNIADEYGAADRDDLWRDTHVRVEGPPAWEMAVVFAEGWQRAGGEPLDLEPLAAEFEPGPPALVLDSRPGRGHIESAAVLALLAGAARRRLWITSSYFAPRRRTVRLLGRVAARGVDVRLLLPGPTDVPLVRHAGHGHFASLLRRGVRLFEYRRSVLHAKTLAADGQVAVVGSSNLDFRSFRFNAECNLVVLDKRAAARLEEAFDEDLESAEEIREPEWGRRRFAHRAGDRLARWLSPIL